MESVLPLSESLGSPQGIFLSVREDGEDRVGSYAAGYCWGNNTNLRPCTSTTENIEELKKVVDASKLPKTFTNAILVCRHLGIRFLWIDSMCIIQNGTND